MNLRDSPLLIFSWNYKLLFIRSIKLSVVAFQAFSLLPYLIPTHPVFLVLPLSLSLITSQSPLSLFRSLLHSLPYLFTLFIPPFHKNATDKLRESVIALECKMCK